MKTPKIGTALLIIAISVFLLMGCSDLNGKDGGAGSYGSTRRWDGSVSVEHAVEEERIGLTENSTESGIDKFVIEVTLGNRNKLSSVLRWYGENDEAAQWEKMFYTGSRVTNTQESTHEAIGLGKSLGYLNLEIDQDNNQYRLHFFADALEVMLKSTFLDLITNTKKTTSEVVWHELGHFTSWHPLPASGLVLKGKEEIVDIVNEPHLKRRNTYIIEWEFKPR